MSALPFAPVPGRLWKNVLVLLGFTTLSFLYFGVRLLPHPGRALLGFGRDPEIFVWSFAWWPHAILHWQNPIVTHAIFAPDGLNLAWTTSVPGLALAFAPLTLLFGPVLAYNVAAILMPALAAWTAYLLCSRLTGSLWASLVGGYLFGFSSYMLGQEEGHLHMTAVFLVPLIALAIVCYLRGDVDGRGLAWRLAILLALQFTFSTELYFTVSVSLAVALVLAFALVRDARPRLRAIVAPLAGAYGLSLVLAGPLVYYAVTGFESDSINRPSTFGTDLLEFVVPGRLVLGGDHFFRFWSRFPGNDAERGAYLGPALLIVVWFAVQQRRSAVGRFLVACAALAAFVTLGTSLRVDGSHVVALPWHLVAGLPLFDNSLPARFALFTSLAVAVIVSLWIEARSGLVAVALPVLAVLALVPAVSRADYRILPQRWPFFTDGLYRICFARDENVLVFPYGFTGDSMLWQAESGFYFRMAEGYVRPNPPPSFLDDPAVRTLTYTNGFPTVPEILQLARSKRVSRILSVQIYVPPSGTEMHEFGAVQLLGGLLVAPGCGHPGIAG